MKKWLFILCFLTACGFADEIRLKDKLAQAAPGNYIVTEQNKSFTLVHIHGRSERSIVIEEVTIPAARYARNPLPWKQWLESGAPGHTSWTMSQINLATGQFEETFSFTHQGWINLSDSDPFLTTLLNLPFSAVPDEKRRRVGIPPGYNKPDYRPIWNPLLIVEGQRVSKIPFSVWRARWPSDRSELSRKCIEIYLPYEAKDPNVPHYPTYFPYWIEVDGKIGSAKIRIIDSGTGARSPKPNLPLRSPELIGDITTYQKGIVFALKAPNYYHDFMIMAEENAFFGNMFPLPCAATRVDKQTVNLFVSREELDTFLTPGHSYRFLISSKENPSVCLEIRKPVEWTRSS